MSVKVKGNKGAVIIVNARGSDNRSAEVSGNVFDDFFVIAEGRFSIDVEAVWTMLVYVGFNFFKGFADMIFHSIKKCSSERISEQSIVEMFDMTPNSFVACAAF